MFDLQIFDIDACDGPSINDWSYCINRRNRYFLTALGVQDTLDLDYKGFGGFIVQKGHPEKAKRLLQLAQISLVEGTITTPDGK